MPRRRWPTPSGLPPSFDDGRHLDDKDVYSSCYAAHASMYFDQLGNVRACCQNSDWTMGNVTTRSLREIWRGDDAGALRRALSVGDFSHGCGFCKWQVDEGGRSPFARDFDIHPVRAEHPEWPVQMEFSMTNSCNLQCIMCNGDWSSSIRAHREHRAPLPEVYGDAFFDELAEFLPHLERANFLGGEPFLGREPLRVMEMMIAQQLRTATAITTNGTQWSDRIERICHSLPMSFVVSLDGATKATYEAIRLGSDFDRVMANIDRFRAIVDGTTTTVSLAHCLMRPNWHEFVDLLLLAEDLEVDAVGVNVVVFPRHLSLYQMPAHELRHVVSTMEEQDRRAAGLTRFRPVWEAQLQALTNRLATLATGPRRHLAALGGVNPWSGQVDPWGDPRRGRAGPVDAEKLQRLTSWAGVDEPMRVRCRADWAFVDGHEITRPILEADPAFLELVGLEPQQVVGRPMNFALEALAQVFGPHHTISPAESGWENHVQADFVRPDGRRHQAQVLITEAGDEVVHYLVHRDPPDE